MRLFLILLLLLPSLAPADLDRAKALYLEGMKLERAKDFRGALEKYEASLKAEPRYYWSHKQAGNCHYHFGDHAAAVKSYDLYLKSKPEDTAIAKFAASLRTKLPAPEEQAPDMELEEAPDMPGLEEEAEEEEEVEEVKPVQRPPWTLIAGGGYHLYTMSGWNSAYGGSASVSYSGYGSSSSISGGITGGFSGFTRLSYRLPSSLNLGGEAGYYSAGSLTKLEAGAGASYVKDEETYNFPLLWIGPSVGWVRQMGPKLDAEVSLAAGWMTVNGSYEGRYESGAGGSYALSTASAAIAASGLGLRLAGSMNYHFGGPAFLYSSLEYRIAALEPRVTPAAYQGIFSGYFGSFGLDYSGFGLRLGLGMGF